MAVVMGTFLPFWMQPAEADPPARPGSALLGFAGVCAACAVYAALYTPSVEGDWGWYPRLAKPGWTPSPAVSGYMSVILFALLAVVGWRIWRTGAFRAIPFTGIGFATLLFLQTIWSTLFYGLQSPLLGLLDVLAMTVLGAMLWLTYRSVDKIAGWLFLPVALWWAFGTVLQTAIWRLNP